MDEIEKNKNGKCLRICPLTSPDEDELIKRLSKILKHPNEPVKQIIHFALSFLARDQNECSVESMIGDIQAIDNSSRPRLSHECATMQEFIRKNGPKPLASWELRKRVLNEMWPMGWHFLSADRVGKFQSTVVSSLVSEAKSSDFCF